MSNLRVVATRDITVSIALLPLGDFSIGLSGNLFSGNRLRDFQEINYSIKLIKLTTETQREEK